MNIPRLSKNPITNFFQNIGLKLEIHNIIQERKSGDIFMEDDLLGVIKKHKLRVNQIKEFVSKVENYSSFFVASIQTPTDFPSIDFSKSGGISKVSNFYLDLRRNLGLENFLNQIKKIKLEKIPERFEGNFDHLFTISMWFNDIYRNATVSIKSKEEYDAYNSILCSMCDAGITFPRRSKKQTEDLAAIFIKYLNTFESNHDQLKKGQISLMEAFNLTDFDKELKEYIKFVY